MDYSQKGLRRRLLVGLLAPLLAILVLSTLLDYRLARQTADAAHDQALADTVFDLESHLRKESSTQAFRLPEEIEAMLRSDAPDVLYFAVLDEHGNILAGDGNLPKPAQRIGNEVLFDDAEHDRQAVRMAALRSRIMDTPVQIVVMETTKKREISRKRILTAMILPNLAVMLACVFAVLFGIRHGLLPLNAIEQDIATRSAADLRPFDTDNAPSEVRPMLKRLNELFDMLREASEAQQRFIADAAHQLRTPLAGLQTQLDLASSEGLFAHHTVRLQLIEEASLRIGRLLNQLLAHARAESSNSVANEFEPVDLSEIIEKAASTFLDAALAKKIDLGFEAPKVIAKALPWVLEEALANLIDNAIRYTPNGGEITVRCGETGGRPFIEVEDDGPGIPSEYLAKVGERFFRVPGSTGNGCGLGLSIAREIAHIHRGHIELHARESGGLQARITL